MSRYEYNVTTGETVEHPDLPAVAVDPEEQLAYALSRIDSDVDGIYRDVIGNRGPEYDRAARDAYAYRAAGYNGPVPQYVATAVPSDAPDARAACDDIIAAAEGWEAAALAMRSTRLTAKGSLRAASTPAELEAITSGWSAFVGYLRSQLGV